MIFDTSSIDFIESILKIITFFIYSCSCIFNLFIISSFIFLSDNDVKLIWEILKIGLFIHASFYYSFDLNDSLSKVHSSIFDNVSFELFFKIDFLGPYIDIKGCEKNSLKLILS